MRELLQDDVGSADVEMAIELRSVLLDRFNRALQRPDAKKFPEGALLSEVVNQLL